MSNSLDENRNPPVSVLMPAFNCARYLTAAMESILSQTFREFEFVVVDDGSTDGSSEILDAFAKLDKRVRVLHQQNTGYVIALQNGLRLCTGEFIARMDADDIAMPERIEKQFEHFQRNPGTALVGCEFYDIDENGAILSQGEYPYVTNRVIRWLLLLCNPMLHPGAMFRRTDILALGGYRQEFYSAEDYELWTRLCTRGTLSNIPMKLMKKRFHAGSVSVQMQEKQAKMTAEISLQYTKAEFPQLDAEAISALSKFLTDGKPPKFGVSRLAYAFEAMAKLLSDEDDHQNPEAIHALGAMRARFGWSFQALARRSWCRPLAFVSYMRAGRRFDPANQSASAVIARKLRRGRKAKVESGSPQEVSS